MSRKSELDLVGVGWPVCFLEYKRSLNGMEPGDILEISMQDPDAVDELVTIVRRSQDQLIEMKKEVDLYRIQIQKGLKEAIHGNR